MIESSSLRRKGEPGPGSSAGRHGAGVLREPSPPLAGTGGIPQAPQSLRETFLQVWVLKIQSWTVYAANSYPDCAFAEDIPPPDSYCRTPNENADFYCVPHSSVLPSAGKATGGNFVQAGMKSKGPDMIKHWVPCLTRCLLGFGRCHSVQ